MLKNEKYIGVYSYKDEIQIEDAVPPIVEPELFYKVQEILCYDQKAAHKNSKADYLLTEKLSCGKRGHMMVGVSGTSKTGTRHHYYYCTEQRKKRCGKKPVRKFYIEELMMEYVAALLQDAELLDFIAENTYQYYLKQNNENHRSFYCGGSLSALKPAQAAAFRDRPIHAIRALFYANLHPSACWRSWMNF